MDAQPIRSLRTLKNKTWTGFTRLSKVDGTNRLDARRNTRREVRCERAQNHCNDTNEYEVGSVEFDGCCAHVISLFRERNDSVLSLDEGENQCDGLPDHRSDRADEKA